MLAGGKCNEVLYFEVTRESIGIRAVFEFEKSLNKKMIDKILFDGFDKKSVKHINSPSYENLMKIAIDSSDAIIKGSENIAPEIKTYLKNFKNPILEYEPIDSFSESYVEFYNKILS